MGRHAWLREQWDGPFMVKGVYRASDAKEAVQSGATAISVHDLSREHLLVPPDFWRVPASHAAPAD